MDRLNSALFGDRNAWVPATSYFYAAVGVSLIYSAWNIYRLPSLWIAFVLVSAFWSAYAYWFARIVLCVRRAGEECPGIAIAMLVLGYAGLAFSLVSTMVLRKGTAPRVALKK